MLDRLSAPKDRGWGFGGNIVDETGMGISALNQRSVISGLDAGRLVMFAIAISQPLEGLPDEVHSSVMHP